jgi:hypothetical protein
MALRMRARRRLHEPERLILLLMARAGLRRAEVPRPPRRLPCTAACRAPGGLSCLTGRLTAPGGAGRPGQDEIFAADFCQVGTVFLRRPYVLSFIKYGPGASAARQR